MRYIYVYIYIHNIFFRKVSSSSSKQHFKTLPATWVYLAVATCRPRHEAVSFEHPTPSTHRKRSSSLACGERLHRRVKNWIGWRFPKFHRSTPSEHWMVYFMENPHLKWMRTGGTRGSSILGRPQISCDWGDGQ